MKFNGKFKVKLIKSTETDAGCAYPEIGKDGGKRVSSVRTDGGGSMVCWTMKTFDYVCDEPEVGDRFEFSLPCSKAEGTILSVREEVVRVSNPYDEATPFQRDCWIVEVDGTVDGAYNSIRDGNPVASVHIPLAGTVEHTAGKSSFRDYVADRLEKRNADGAWVAQWGTQEERDVFAKVY